MNFFSLINGVYNMPALWLTARRLRSMSLLALGTPTRNPPTHSTPGDVYVGASNDAYDSAPSIATSAFSVDALGGRLSSYADYTALPWTRMGHRDTPRNTFRDGGPKLKATRTTSGQEEDGEWLMGSRRRGGRGRSATRALHLVYIPRRKTKPTMTRRMYICTCTDRHRRNRQWDRNRRSRQS